MGFLNIIILPVVICLSQRSSQEETPASQEETPASQEEIPVSQEETPASQEETPASQEEIPRSQGGLGQWTGDQGQWTGGQGQWTGGQGQWTGGRFDDRLHLCHLLHLQVGAKFTTSNLANLCFPIWFSWMFKCIFLENCKIFLDIIIVSSKL